MQQPNPPPVLARVLLLSYADVQKVLSAPGTFIANWLVPFDNKLQASGQQRGPVCVCVCVCVCVRALINGG